MIIRVVSGLAVQGGDILMGLRKPSGLRPNMWELPGGKVEQTGNFEEAPKRALAREWKEELGVDIEPAFIGPMLASSLLDVDLTLVVELYPVLVGPDFRPRPLDHVELRWVDPTEAVRHLPCSPAYYLHYKAIMSWMNQLRGKVSV